MKTNVIISAMLILSFNSIKAQDTLPHITYLDSIILYIHPTDNASNVEWGNKDIEITYGNGADDIWNGIPNTEAIVSQLGDNGGVPYAAKICDTLDAYGYTDWYLPTLKEWRYICLGYESLNIFNPNVAYQYWGSLENYPDQGELANVVKDGWFVGSHYKNYLFDVRCIRREKVISTANPELKSATKKLVIKPNLSKNEINVTISGVSGNVELNIYNIKGEKISTKKIEKIQSNYSEKIDISKYAKGTYLVEIKNAEFVKTEKFVVQ